MSGFFQMINFSDNSDEQRLPTQKPADWHAMLKAVPEHNRATQTQWLDDGSLVLTVSKRRPRFLVPPISWVFRPRLQKRVELDRLGAQAWRLCDGRHTVEDVIDEFARRFQLTFHEARVAVTGYLKELVKRGALVMLMADETYADEPRTLNVDVKA